MRNPILQPSEIEVIKTTILGMSEKERRLFLGRIASVKKYGIISELSRALGVSRNMIARGKAEVEAGAIYHKNDRNRRSGGGRWSAEKRHQYAIEALELPEDEHESVVDLDTVVKRIIEEWAYGDPMSTKKWANVTASKIRKEVIKETGQKYSFSTIKKIVKRIGYSLQKNQKYLQVGKPHPKRDAQFKIKEKLIKEYKENGWPIISIDTLTKVKLGIFFRAGWEWRRKGDPRKVYDHDFSLTFRDIYPNGSPYIPEELMDKLAIVAPYGVYDYTKNKGFILFGISHDTTEFAVTALLQWWEEIGKFDYPEATKILILADGGGSNRAAGYTFKEGIQQFSDTTQLDVRVFHFPAGNSKFNYIERRLWSPLTHTWSGKTLDNIEYAVEYARHTTTEPGLTVKADICSTIFYTMAEKKKLIAEGKVPYGIIDTPELRKALNIEHYEIADKQDKDGKIVDDNSALRKWNYTIKHHTGNECWKDFKAPQATVSVA